MCIQKWTLTLRAWSSQQVRVKAWTVLAMVRTTTACRAAPAMEATIHIPTDYRLTSARPVSDRNSVSPPTYPSATPSWQEAPGWFPLLRKLSPLNPCNALYQTLPNPTNTHRQAICGFSKNMWCGNAVLTCLFCCVWMRNCGSVPKPSNCLAVYRLHKRSILTEKKKKLYIGLVMCMSQGSMVFLCTF